MSSDVPRMLAAVKKGNAAEEGCQLERELAAAIASIDEERKRAQREGERVIAALAQRDKARDDALEKAAVVCDSEASCEGIAQKCAAAIRAMKECGK